MMTVNTTTHAAPPAPKTRIELAEPGEGYRLLKAHEVILSTDEVWSQRGSWSRWTRDGLKTGSLLNPYWRPRRRKLPTTQELYNELLFAVARKHENETRHQTALRYINEAETLTTRTTATRGRSSDSSTVGVLLHQLKLLQVCATEGHWTDFWMEVGKSKELLKQFPNFK